MPNLELATRILEEYASGSEPLDTVAKRHGTTAKTVRQWSVSDRAIGAVYAHARTISAGALEDAAIEVANACTPESYQSDRVKIDTYKWAAAKRHPKEYGDKVEVQQDTTLRVVVERVAAELAQPVAAPQITATASLALPCE